MGKSDTEAAQMANNPHGRTHAYTSNNFESNTPVSSPSVSNTDDAHETTNNTHAEDKGIFFTHSHIIHSNTFTNYN